MAFPAKQYTYNIEGRKEHRNRIVVIKIVRENEINFSGKKGKGKGETKRAATFF